MSGDALPVCSYGRALRFGAGLFVAGSLSRGRKRTKTRFILAFSVCDAVRQGKPGSGVGLGAVGEWFRMVGEVINNKRENNQYISISIPRKP